VYYRRAVFCLCTRSSRGQLVNSRHDVGRVLQNGLHPLAGRGALYFVILTVLKIISASEVTRWILALNISVEGAECGRHALEEFTGRRSWLISPVL
jgi:recombinational DNA repair protein RecR